MRQKQPLGSGLDEEDKNPLLPDKPLSVRAFMSSIAKIPDAKTRPLSLFLSSCEMACFSFVAVFGSLFVAQNILGAPIPTSFGILQDEEGSQDPDLPSLDEQGESDAWFPDSNESVPDSNETANGPLEIQAAIESAMANDPGFQQINWKIEQAKGDRHQATRYPNPSTGLTANEIGNEGSGGQYGVFWSQSIVRNNRQALQHRYFSLTIATLQQQYDIRRWQVARNIGKRYLKATRLKVEHEITSQQIESLGEVLEITRKLFDAGEISQVAVGNIELELDSLRQKLVELKLQRDYELRALAIPLGLSSGVSDVSSIDSENLQIQFDWQPTISELLNGSSTALDQAWLAAHPQISFAEAEVQQSRWKIELAKAERCPDVQLQGSLTYDTATDDVFAGFQVGRPVLKCDRKNGAIAAAKAAYQQRVEGVRMKQMQLQSMYTIGEGKIARLRSRVVNIRETIIPKAEKNLQQVRGAFEIGEQEFLMLKSGLEQVLQSRVDLLDAEYDLAVASVELRTLLLDE